MEKTFIEKFDSTKLNTIIQNEPYFRTIIENRRGTLDKQYCPFKIASSYLFGSKNNTYEVTYTQRSHRLFANGSRSLQSFPKEIRHTICKEYYVDLDMINCHPIIFEYLCRKNNFNCPNLTEYITNRDEKLLLISDNRDIAKTVYLSIINGGIDAYNNVKIKHEFLINFRREINKLHSKFADLYETQYDEHREKREELGKNYNHLGSFINKLFCKYENDILMEVWNYYNQSEHVVLCFDGIMLEKSMFNVNDIPKIEKLVITKIGIDMKFKVKEMDFEFDFTGIPMVDYDDSEFGIIQRKTKKTLSSIEFEIIKDEIIDYVNKEHCLISCGRTFYMKECIDLNCSERYFELVYKDIQSMRIDFADKDLTFCINDDKPKTINVFDIWNKSPKRRKYDGIDFMPYSSDISKIDMEKTLSKKYKKYNIFHGLSQNLENLENVEPYEYDINNAFFGHIFNRWALKDQELTDYILNWFAHLIQKPHIKMGTALVLKSQERSGKGIIIQKIGEILGLEYFFQPLNINDVMGSFNGGLANKLLVFLDELCWGGDKTKSGILKKIITEKQITINEKHKPVYSCNNCINTIIASNEEWIVPSGMTSTRYQVIETSDELSLMPNNDNKKKIIDDLLNIDISRLAKFFYNRDISNFNPSHIIETEALLSQKIQSLSPRERWYLEILIDGKIGEWDISNKINKQLILDNYNSRNKFCNNVALWLWLKKASQYTEHRKNGQRVVQFAEIDILRKKWNSANNCNIDFDNYRDDEDEDDGECYESFSFSL